MAEQFINVPNTPTGVAVVAVGNGVFTVAWNQGATQVRPISLQTLDRWDNVTNGWVRISDQMGDSRRSLDVGVAGARTYQFRVNARNSAGSGGWGYSDYYQTAPATPGGCSASKTGPDSIVVNWNNSHDNWSYTFVTTVEESVNGGGWTEIAVVGDGASSLSRGGRTPGSTYAYRVRHAASRGPGGYSDYAYSGTVQIFTLPAAPTIGSVVRTNDNSFTLNWTNNPNNTTAPYDGLTVQRYDNVSATWSTIGTLGPTATSMTDTSTVVDRAYQWRIAATNSVGQSAWATYAAWQTRPAPPIEVKAKAAPNGALQLNWINAVSYSQYTTRIRYLKNGTLVTNTITLPVGETSYLLTGVDLTATYQFGVKTVSSVGYASESDWVDSASLAASTIPNAPANLAPTGTVIDGKLANTFTWTHNPSLDGADQTAFTVNWSIDNGSTWVSSGKITSKISSWVMPANTIPNGRDILWRVQTWGVHATVSAWSTQGVFRSSTTPTVTINTPASSTLTISRVQVAWAYGDVEGLPQASWEVELLDSAGSLVERKTGSGTATTLTLDTAVTNGLSYTLRVRVTDGDGLKSNWAQKSLNANFIPPAMPTLTADYSQDTGVTVLTLTPKSSDGGVTNLPATGVDIQRRLLDQATGEYGAWDLLAQQVAPNATLIDTTGPIAGDGQYRAVAYSAAPSAATSPWQEPQGSDDRWVYLSGGPGFRQVARLMGNVALRTTTSRDRALYSFAGRDKPVMFAGEAKTRVIDVAGLLDGESSSAAEWEALIANCDVMLFRDPLGHRIYGSVPEVAIDFLGGDMYAISFTVTEVSYP